MHYWLRRPIKTIKHGRGKDRRTGEKRKSKHDCRKTSGQIKREQRRQRGETERQHLKIITPSSSPPAWFPFLSVKISNGMFPHQQLPQGASRTTRWWRAEAAYLPGGRAGQGSTGPCLQPLPARDVELPVGKLLLLSSHHTHGILMREGTLFMLPSLDKCVKCICGP